MKIVVIRRGGVAGFLLRRRYGIKKIRNAEA